MLNFLRKMFNRKPSLTGYEEWYLSQAADVFDLERRQKDLMYKRQERHNNINYI